ncbi:MAG: PEP/pyruvate-binding domain-containing protein, partial [Planctomycetota bacterium]
LGTVIMPPLSGAPAEPDFQEYGIQLIRQDPYTREEIVTMFEVVQANVIADPNVQAFYFPTYEQTEIAQANLQWFEDQNVPVSSTARWAQGNVCYSQGWALGELKFFAADDIDGAYHAGLLEPNDILLTDAVPAEIPFVAGVISLSPSTPSSHGAILAQSYGVPFVYLAVAEDANQAQQLLGRTIAFSAYDDGLGGYDVRLLDVEDELTDVQIAEILELKEPPDLDISPVAHCGQYSADTNGLSPEDINCFGGKASNFGILRTAIGENSPNAVSFSFDMWSEFLDQTVTASNSVTIGPNSFLLFWADNDQEQGPTHAGFKLTVDGEDVALYDRDGTTLIDGITFGPQTSDVSYGRLPDGNDNWVLFDGNATPGWSNSGGAGPGQGLFINEFMAENDTTIQDPHGSGYPDWIELYNAGDSVVDLGGMYLTDDMNEPTEWMIPVGITGVTLGEEINNRLSGYSYPPSDMSALSADLAAIRSMFTNTGITSFSQQLQDAVIATLQDANYGFDPNENIRFRSSTNVEDSEQFTGAGLYSSYSGCLADELDGDELGPCICDPCELEERGVFRAIRKVFASFYNDNAFLERLRHDINEADVGMAVLAHHSFPDEIELANGVATLDKRGSGANMYITLVTQDGAVSVTNPDPSSIPEEVTVRVYASGTVGPPKLIRSSNLVPLGAKVMDWDQDYRDLADLLIAASDEFSNVTGKTTYMLDLEYKKVSPGGAALPAGGLVVKQIREIPQPNDVPSITPFLINQPTEYCVFSGEYEFMDGTDVFATHRLKCRLMLETKSVWLDEPNLIEGFYADANFEYFDGNSIRTINEPLPLLPFAYHGFDGTDANDGWTLDALANTRTYELWTENIPTLVSQAQNPLLALRDFGSHPFMLSEPRFRLLGLRVDYDDPVRWWAGDDCSPAGLAATINNELYLWKSPEPSADDLLQQRYYESGGVSISTEFYWPPPQEADGTWEMSTAPMARWVQTVIEGYTTDPIVLTGYYSQTYHAGHHNVMEYFLFEPRLEPGISQDILDELEAEDIRLIHLTLDNWGSGSSLTTYGFDFLAGDFSDDGRVDLVDFASFAQRWPEADCCSCGGIDLTGDRQIRLDDLRELAENWLAAAPD